MSLFDKITHIVNLTSNTTKEQVEEYLFPPEKEKEMRNLITSSNHLWPRPNDDVEFVVPLFDARKHYKHLKKQMWKFSRRY